jgi:LuxR family quorum sensing-dependent transcriptional regulator
LSYGEKTRCFLDHAQKEGVFNGIAVSSHGMDDDGCDTLVTLDMGSVALPRNWMVILQLFVAHIHGAAKRLHLPQKSGKNEASPLTAREIETLQWAKEGKSAWEIGKIMGISERTVKFHFSNIYAKLNVVNRTQAVALGVSHGLI